MRLARLQHYQAYLEFDSRGLEFGLPVASLEHVGLLSEALPVALLMYDAGTESIYGVWTGTRKVSRCADCGRRALPLRLLAGGLYPRRGLLLLASPEWQTWCPWPSPGLAQLRIPAQLRLGRLSSLSYSLSTFSCALFVWAMQAIEKGAEVVAFCKQHLLQPLPLAQAAASIQFVGAEVRLPQRLSAAAVRRGTCHTVTINTICA